MGARDLDQIAIHRTCKNRGRTDACTCKHADHRLLLATKGECDDGAGFTCTSCAACAVQVILVVGGSVNIHDEADAVHVDATGGHISCHQHCIGHLLERRESACANPLRHAAMQHSTRNA